MRCSFEEFDLPDEKGWRRVRCSRCKFVTAPTPHECSSVFKECDLLGLGDYVAHGLAAFGITKERVSWVKRQFGGSDCNCGQRQESMNEAGKQIGL